jgi:Tol biopolymer transport system component
LRRLVAEPGFDCIPGLFSPDGERLAYACRRPEGGGGVYLATWDGSGSPQRIIEQQQGEFVFALSFWPDGRKLLFRRIQSAEDRDVTLMVSLDADGNPTENPTPLLDDFSSVELSPDGRWLAYSSDASGAWQVYLRRLDENGRLGPEVPVTGDGGSTVIWSPEIIDGRQTLYYLNADRKTTSVTLEPGDRARLSPPRVYPELAKLIPKVAGARPIAGSRWFLLLENEDERPASEMHVILNFTRELSERP